MSTPETVRGHDVGSILEELHQHPELDGLTTPYFATQIQRRATQHGLSLDGVVCALRAAAAKCSQVNGQRFELADVLGYINAQQPGTRAAVSTTPALVRSAADRAYCALRALGEMRVEYRSVRPPRSASAAAAITRHHGSNVAQLHSLRAGAVAALAVARAFAAVLDIDEARIANLMMLVDAGAEDVGDDLAAALLFMDARDALDAAARRRATTPAREFHVPTEPPPAAGGAR